MYMSVYVYMDVCMYVRVHVNNMFVWMDGSNVYMNYA